MSLPLESALTHVATRQPVHGHNYIKTTILRGFLLILWRFTLILVSMPSIPPRRSPKHTPVLVKGSLERLGKRLVLARKLREMTQEQLATLSDVSPSTLRSLEEGADGVSIGNLLKVLQGLQLLGQMDDVLDPQHDPEAVHFAARQVAR